MATFSNTGKGRLVLPDGRGLEPGESAEVDASILDSVVVAAWVETGTASIADALPEQAPAPEPEPAPVAKGKKR